MRVEDIAWTKEPTRSLEPIRLQFLEEVLVAQRIDYYGNKKVGYHHRNFHQLWDAAG